MYTRFKRERNIFTNSKRNRTFGRRKQNPHVLTDLFKRWRRSNAFLGETCVRIRVRVYESFRLTRMKITRRDRQLSLFIFTLVSYKRRACVFTSVKFLFHYISFVICFLLALARSLTSVPKNGYCCR